MNECTSHFTFFTIDASVRSAEISRMAANRKRRAWVIFTFLGKLVKIRREKFDFFFSTAAISFILHNSLRFDILHGQRLNALNFHAIFTDDSSKNQTMDMHISSTISNK